MNKKQKQIMLDNLRLLHKSGTGIHIDNISQGTELLKVLEKLGVKWNAGQKATRFTEWKDSCDTIISLHHNGLKFGYQTKEGNDYLNIEFKELYKSMTQDIISKIEDAKMDNLVQEKVNKKIKKIIIKSILSVVAATLFVSGLCGLFVSVTLVTGSALLLMTVCSLATIVLGIVLVRYICENK